MDVVTEEGDIISLANTSNMNIAKIEAKSRLLCDNELLLANL